MLYLPTPQSCCDVNELTRVKLGAQWSVVVPICHPSTWRLSQEKLALEGIPDYEISPRPVSKQACKHKRLARSLRGMRGTSHQDLGLGSV